MKILLFACVWKRPAITEIFAAGIRRLQKHFDIEPLTICSTDEDLALCQKLNLNPINVANSPLGRKHNSGLKFALDLSWDRLLLMGSDNAISSEGVQMLIDSNKLHAGFRKMIAYEARSGYMLQHEYARDTRIIGAGRLIHREALALTNSRALFHTKDQRQRYSEVGQIMSNAAASHLERRGKGKKKGLFTGAWDENLDRNLDNSLDTNLSLCGFPPYCIEDERIHILDIKSDNLNGFGVLHLQEGKVEPYTGGWDWFLSDEEKSMIQALKVENP